MTKEKRESLKRQLDDIYAASDYDDSVVLAALCRIVGETLAAIAVDGEA